MNVFSEIFRFFLPVNSKHMVYEQNSEVWPSMQCWTANSLLNKLPLSLHCVCLVGEKEKIQFKTWEMGLFQEFIYFWRVHLVQIKAKYRPHFFG